METANYVMALNAMELNETVLILREKALANCDLANCSLVQDAKDLCMKGMSFLKALNSMAEYRQGSNVKGLNRTDLLEYSLMMVLNKSDSSSYNCSHG